MKLSEWRKSHNHSQIEFAEMAGVTGSFKSLIESGKIPSRRAAKKIESCNEGTSNGRLPLGAQSPDFIDP
jgi:transcriptional regulator with XRE-family HTH domain